MLWKPFLSYVMEELKATKHNGGFYSKARTSGLYCIDTDFRKCDPISTVTDTYRQRQRVPLAKEKQIVEC